MLLLEIDPELIARLRAIAKQCRLMIGEVWRTEEVQSLCEEADRLSTRAQHGGLIDLSESLLGFGIYLSSFADNVARPSREHMQQVEVLVEAIEDALRRYLERVEAASLAPQAQVPHLVQRTIVYFSHHYEHTALLEKCFAMLEYRVSSHSNLAEVEAVLAADAALAIILDEDVLTEWHAANRVGDTGAASARVPLAVITAHDLLSVRLAAMRCAAEIVFVLPEDQDRIARRLAALIADRTEQYRVLIVDDDKSMRMYCASILRHNNLEPHAVATPEEALVALHDFSPDVILVDLYMPQVSGLELLALFRAHPRTAFTPVVLLSGDSNAERRFDALHIGGDDFLLKPIRPRHLVAAVISRARRARWMRRELLV